ATTVAIAGKTGCGRTCIQWTQHTGINLGMSVTDKEAVGHRRNQLLYTLCAVHVFGFACITRRAETTRLHHADYGAGHTFFAQYRGSTLYGLQLVGTNGNQLQLCIVVVAEHNCTFADSSFSLLRQRLLFHHALECNHHSHTSTLTVKMMQSDYGCVAIKWEQYGCHI